MYKRLGNIGHDTQEGNPTLRSLKGELFEVSLLSLLIWEKLDGKTPVLQISGEIAEYANMDEAKLSSTISYIMEEFTRLNLIKKMWL